MFFLFLVLSQYTYVLWPFDCRTASLPISGFILSDYILLVCIWRVNLYIVSCKLPLWGDPSQEEFSGRFGGEDIGRIFNQWI